MKSLQQYPLYWAAKFVHSDAIPTSRAEMGELGWTQCDIVLVTGDAFVDHPSYGVAVMARVLLAHGFRVGVLDQPDWREGSFRGSFDRLGEPKLFFGVSAGNMDSMVNKYTADGKRRSDDAYSPDGKPDRRPDRASIVYAQRCRELYPHTFVVMGGIEASLRRLAHYDYWSGKLRRSILLDAKADLLIHGNGERSILELAFELARRQKAKEPLRAPVYGLRGTAVALSPHELPEALEALGRQEIHSHPPQAKQTGEGAEGLAGSQQIKTEPLRLPALQEMINDFEQYAQATKLIYRESNPGNARPLLQEYGSRQVLVYPPPWPLTTEEMDWVYGLPYTRKPHDKYQGHHIAAYEMIKDSITLMRGCFGGCSFCSITLHEGRRIQNRSEDSVLREIDDMAQKDFGGVVSDLGGPSANMYRMGCDSGEREAKCKASSCIYPRVCPHLHVDHGPLRELYRRVRAHPAVKRAFVASGIRYDLAVYDPDYIRELAEHHVGGYLKIAPEHISSHSLRYMYKPGIESYDRFAQLFGRFSAQAGKEQYLIPYFIAAHPGTRIQDMAELALWLKQRRLRPRQVQTFLPTPMTMATAMQVSGQDPRTGDELEVVRRLKWRQAHKAFLHYYKTENWPLLRKILRESGLAQYIGPGKGHVVPPEPEPREAKPRPRPKARQKPQNSKESKKLESQKGKKQTPKPEPKTKGQRRR